MVTILHQHQLLLKVKIPQIYNNNKTVSILSLEQMEK